jgi:hypothetical protein
MRAAILAFAAALILRPCGLGRPFVAAGTMAVKARIAASVLWISFCKVVRCDFSSETMVDRFVMREFYGAVVHASRESVDWPLSRFESYSISDNRCSKMFVTGYSATGNSA